MPRQSVFVGTTNASEYLTDSTGGRRFWPVRCTNIDIEALARDREQLWAEAVTAYHAGEHWWLDAAATRDAMQREQEERRIADPWEDIISAWLEEPTRLGHDGVRVPFNLERGRVANALILDHAICKPTERQTTSDQMRVGKDPCPARLDQAQTRQGQPCGVGARRDTSIGARRA